jgi:hypothetical protein
MLHYIKTSSASLTWCSSQKSHDKAPLETILDKPFGYVKRGEMQLVLGGQIWLHDLSRDARELEERVS